MDGNLDIVGPCVSWHGAASRGRLRLGGVELPVMVLLGAEGAASDAFAKAAASAAPLVGARTPGLHVLRAVTRVGDRVAWAYEAVRGIGLVHTVGQEGRALLSTRAAAELVARVAEVLIEAGVELRNRGPEPSDLLITVEGGVFVSGFAGPYPMSPAMRAPRGDEGEAAVVYRLGVLMVHLLCGTPPHPAGERSGQAALVRRALIRVMARPGPALPERYADWIRGMMAWDPDERPPLSNVASGLRAAAAGADGAALAEWAAEHVPRLVAESEQMPTGAVPPPSRAPTAIFGQDDATEQRSVGGLFRPTGEGATPIGAPARHSEDDPTQEATAVPNASVQAQPTRTQPGVGPSIPVRVGPPPEAIREVRLPAGFLEATSPEEDSAPPGPWLGAAAAVVWVALVGVLLVFAVVLGLYVFWPAPAPTDDGPSLHEAIPSGS